MKPICVRAITGDTLHGCLPSLSAKSRTWKSAGVRGRMGEGRGARGRQREAGTTWSSYFKERAEHGHTCAFNGPVHAARSRFPACCVTGGKKLDRDYFSGDRLIARRYPCFLTRRHRVLLWPRIIEPGEHVFARLPIHPRDLRLV